MIDKKILFSLVIGLFCAVSCQNKDRIIFEGDIKNAKDGAIIRVSELQNDELVLLDSAEIKNGKFSVSLPTTDDEPAFYQIGYNNQNALMTLARRNEKVTFYLNSDNIVKNYTVSGAKDAELMQKLDHQLQLFIDSTDYLLNIYYEAMDNDSLRAEVERCYEQIKMHHTNYLQNFIRQNNQSLSIIIAFYQKYNNGRFFSEDENRELLQYIYDSLKKKYPNNEYVDWLSKRLSRKSEQKES